MEKKKTWKTKEYVKSGRRRQFPVKWESISKVYVAEVLMLNCTLAKTKMNSLSYQQDAEGWAGRHELGRKSKEEIYGSHETGREVREEEEAKDLKQTIAWYRRWLRVRRNIKNQSKY